MRLMTLLTALACVLTTSPAWAGIKDTKHNLSAAGPGAIVATDEKRICIFCHTPHRASLTQGLL